MSYGRGNPVSHLISTPWGRTPPCAYLISQTVFLKSFNKGQSPHKSVNLFFILVVMKVKLTYLWGGRRFKTK